MPILNTCFRSLLITLLLIAPPATLAVKVIPLDEALSLSPNAQAGEKTYRLCAACHGKDGFGEQHGEFPSIAGQHQNVIIKQILDIQVKNRINPAMYPFTDLNTLGGLQGVVDIAAYAAQLPSNTQPVKGDGSRVQAGEKLFRANCTACHGENAQGNNEHLYPRLKNQHYPYLVRELTWIKARIRKNADPAMVAILQNLSEEDIQAVADYISQLD